MYMDMVRIDINPCFVL